MKLCYKRIETEHHYLNQMYVQDQNLLGTLGRIVLVCTFILVENFLPGVTCIKFLHLSRDIPDLFAIGI